MSLFDLMFLLPILFGGGALFLLLVVTSTYWHGPSRRHYERRRAVRAEWKKARARENLMREAVGLKRRPPRLSRRERARRGWF